MNALHGSIATAGLLLLIAMSPARADIEDALNEVRVKGCENRPGVKTPFAKSKDIDTVAREWSKGGRLREAIERTGYRARNSASMHVTGNRAERAVLEVLTDNYCEILTDAEFTHIGSYSEGDATWVVVARPFVLEGPDRAQAARRALALVNTARAKTRRCGNKSFTPAAPLRLSSTLEQAALAHAKDMARHQRFDHIGSDGSRPADRVSRTGYSWRNVGENIAAGYDDVDDIVQGWLDSPGHCANIMNPQYTEMGIAFALEPKSAPGIYWAQVFARPR